MLSRRSELPEPKKGQNEWNLFTELYGQEWNHFDSLMFDQEQKITEFNYENYIPQHLLDRLDTHSNEFKTMIKAINLNRLTEYEQHIQNQEQFKQIMPVLSKLDAEEKQILIHLIKNKNRTINQSAQTTNDLVDQACSDSLKTRLAKISEEQNFAAKNRYLLEKNLLKYGKKERMPIDQVKIKDILRNQNHVRGKIVEEIQTYHQFIENSQLNFESGLLTYINEASWGDLRDLLKDIGINRETIRYSNVADVIAAKDDRLFESDIQFKNLVNNRFTMIDMTDYEYTFPSPNEVGYIPMHDIGRLTAIKPEPFPQVNSFAEVVPMETLSPNVLNKTHKEILAERAAEAEAEEEEDEDEDEEDEDEEEGDEEEGDDEEGDDDEDEEEEEPAVPPNFTVGPKYDDRYFKHGEKLRERFNEVELDGFMKLLNMKPVTQWQDDTTHHYKVGAHTYEDEAQMTDPYFHLLAEVERKALDRNEAIEFRRGTEVKLIPDAKKAPVFSRQ